MKFFAAFAALVAVTAAAPTTSWTLNDLSQAIQSPATPAAVLPYLEDALNQMMAAIFAGHPVDSIAIPTPAGLLPVEAVSPAVVMPAEVDLAPAAPTTSWTLDDLSQAIQNPATPAAVLPYLEDALNQMMAAIFAGHPVDSIVVPTPAGLLPVEAVSPAVVMPAEVDLAPVDQVLPGLVPAPVVPAPTVIADAAGSPLVQIIVNIKSQESTSVVPSPVPSPVIVPDAVYEPEALPTPVPSPVIVPEAVYEPQPLPTPVVVPEPIVIGPAPAPVVIAPEPVVIAPEVPAPIVIAPAPIEMPSPSELLQPTPVVLPSDWLKPTPVAA